MDKVLNKGTLNNQAEGQDSWGQTILCGYDNKRNKKQVKETVPVWSQNWLLLCSTSLSGSFTGLLVYVYLLSRLNNFRISSSSKH